jgi:hypothetical protein
MHDWSVFEQLVGDGGAGWSVFLTLCARHGQQYWARRVHESTRGHFIEW